MINNSSNIIGSGNDYLILGKKQFILDNYLILRHNNKRTNCGYSSVVERHLAKVNVARSNRVTRFE